MTINYAYLEFRNNKLYYFKKDTGISIKPDQKLWRIVYPDGVISDWTNLTRAKDFAKKYYVETENRRLYGSKTL
jgi:hypothetical protein